MRQQLNLDEGDEVATAHEQLPLNAELKEEWMRGELTSSQVQRLASAAGRQGTEGVGRLAGVGTHGAHGSNMFRALKTLFGNAEDAPFMQWLEIPTTRGRLTAHPFVYPHELFACLFKARNRKFHWSQAVLGSGGPPDNFWKSQEDMD